MSGDAALGILSAGLLLIVLECNRPGKILPGALGLLLFLIGADELSRNSIPPPTLWLLCCGSLSILLLWWRPLFGFPAALGSVCLTVGLASLAKLPSRQISLPWAIGCGLTLGVLSSWLMLIAGRARRAKRSHRHASAEPWNSDAPEHWGVD